MKTTLIFFDSITESKKGTFRGLIAFIVLLGITIPWLYLTYNTFYKSSVEGLSKDFNTRSIFSTILIYLILCSAIAVQIPSSYKNAFIYGLLVGFVVFGIANLTFLLVVDQYIISTCIIDTIFGTLLCGFASICTYYFGKLFKMY